MAIPIPSTLDWAKSPRLYTLTRDGQPLGPEIHRVGKVWILHYGSYRVALGRRASFDTAERALARLGFIA